MRSNVLVSAFAALVCLGACDDGSLAVTTAPRADTSTSALGGARYQIDRVHGRAWRLSMKGVSMRQDDQSRETAIELPNWLVAGVANGCLPTLALGPRGEVLVTSDVVPTIWRIDPDTLAVTTHPIALDADNDRDVGFTGLAYSAEQDAYFAVSHVHGSAWKIDSSLTRAEKLLPTDPFTLTLERTFSCAIS